MGIYRTLEDAYYDILDKVNKVVPIYAVIDPIDKIIPSFILFVALFLLIIAGIGYIVYIQFFQPTGEVYKASIKVVAEEGGTAISGADVNISLEENEISGKTNEFGFFDFNMQFNEAQGK